MSHLLEVNNLDVKFDTDEGRITAIDNVSLTLDQGKVLGICLLYTSPSPRDKRQSRMPSSA